MKLKENNKAPNFKLTSTNGNIFELNKVKKKNIILYFYPKDDTPGCTIAVSYTHLTLPTT